MASTPLTTALGFPPALHDPTAYPSWPPSSRAPSSCPAAPMDSPAPSHAEDLAAGIAGAVPVPLLGAGHSLTRDGPLAITDAIVRASNIPAAAPHSTEPVMALDGG